MAFLTLITVAGGALVASVATRRKPAPPRLVDALIDGEPKQATLLPSSTRQAVSRIQTVAQDLFGDTRQQYQQTLNTAYTDDAEQRAEAIG